MNFPGFIGQSYQAASLRADAERTMNLFPEEIPAAGGQGGQLVLFRTPGLKLLQTLAASPCRGAFQINGRVFAVAGNTLFELLTPATSVVRGVLAAAGTSPVAIAATGTQVCIIADGLGYILTLASNAFAQIVGQDGFPVYAVDVTSIDTYFIVLSQNTNQFSISGPLDGLTWSGLDFGSSEAPDNAVALAQSHLYLWIFGNNSTVIFQDTGDSNFPFQRVPGSSIEQGCAAANSVVDLDNTLFWLGDDSRGPCIVYRADGFLPTRVSTHAVEYAIANYPRHDDAVAYSYQESGHLFYVLHFPSANAGAGATWVYDVATKLWHERAYWDTAAGAYAAHRGRYHAFGFNQHLLFDYTSGKVYNAALANVDDAGNPLRWLRAAPHLSVEDKWLFFHSLQIDMQVGGGLPANVDPAVMLRWSDDGGFTWSNYKQQTTGKLGEYARRVVFRRLGRGRSRVFELTGSDPVPELCLVGAYLDFDKGVS